MCLHLIPSSLGYGADSLSKNTGGILATMLMMSEVSKFKKENLIHLQTDPKIFWWGKPAARDNWIHRDR
jgi:hypothetical protein